MFAARFFASFARTAARSTMTGISRPSNCTTEPARAMSLLGASAGGCANFIGMARSARAAVVSEAMSEKAIARRDMVVLQKIRARHTCVGYEAYRAAGAPLSRQRVG